MKAHFAFQMREVTNARNGNVSPNLRWRTYGNVAFSVFYAATVGGRRNPEAVTTVDPGNLYSPRTHSQSGLFEELLIGDRRGGDDRRQNHKREA